MIVHAGLIAMRLRGRWRGALIEGPAGAGKSDLALRCLQQGWRLAADDRVVLWTSDGRLFGSAPLTLGGLIEVRGQGVLCVAALPLCEVNLLVRCEAPERTPAPERAERLGVRLPALALEPLEASAPARLRLALEQALAAAEPQREVDPVPRDEIQG